MKLHDLLLILSLLLIGVCYAITVVLLYQATYT